MPKKTNPNPDQLSLFNLEDYEQPKNTETNKPLNPSNKKNKKPKSSKTYQDARDNFTNKETPDYNIQKIENLEKVRPLTSLNTTNTVDDLLLPFTYEEIVSKIGENEFRLSELIVPVTEFEELILQVVMDITNAGYLLFLYGVSGVGKSSFISSLEFQTHIPIKEIVSIDASELTNDPTIKLKQLYNTLKEEALKFKNNNSNNDKKLCIVIDYLEHLKDEDENQVLAFFRDLSRLLRKHAILIIWPVTVRQDLETMQNFAKSYSSSMFHRRIPVIEFTGPPIDEYPNIAKKTIMLFNKGKSCYEFQLNDNDFEDLKKKYEEKPKDQHLIREYLKDVKICWEDRTDYISQIVKTVPKLTEVWFIFSYPEAEGVVARFAKQTPDIINEMWNADYKSLNAYINDNTQRQADWGRNSKRLTLALSSRILTTKIMYLPTNALVSCITAYAEDAKIPNLTKEKLIDKNEYNVLEYWFRKSSVKNTLQRTPLYSQLLGRPIKVGKRKSGTVEKGLMNAKKAFKKINEDISKSRISDRHFNKAFCLALQDVCKEQSNFSFSCEKEHPHLTNIRPDILVNTQEKLICLELCYTNDNTPGNLADYVLRKLNIYMKQLLPNDGITY
ncbi:MAG: hypothetical protein WAN66_18590 [Limnoraphis robusta]